MPRRYTLEDYADTCYSNDDTRDEPCMFVEAEGRCFPCNVRSVQVSPKATPSKRNNVAPRVNPDANAIERGVLTDAKSGRPILDGNGKVIPMKKYRENRRHYDDLVKRAKTGAPPSSAPPK